MSLAIGWEELVLAPHQASGVGLFCFLSQIILSGNCAVPTEQACCPQVWPSAPGPAECRARDMSECHWGPLIAIATNSPAQIGPACLLASELCAMTQGSMLSAMCSEGSRGHSDAQLGQEGIVCPLTQHSLLQTLVGTQLVQRNPGPLQEGHPGWSQPS